MLKDKSLHELRAIAQGYGIADIFSKDAVQLAQAIELKQVTMAPALEVPFVQPSYDARLMTAAPADISDEKSVRELLQPLVDRGLHLSFDPERWYMAHGKRTDEGTMRMPLRVVLRCAEKLMA